jgi:hypothetical protein
MVFNNGTFNKISVISWQLVLLVEETAVPRENHPPQVTDKCNGVSSKPRLEPDSNSQLQ